MLARKGYQPSQAFRIVGEVLDDAVSGAGAGSAPDF
jgi:regulatory protein